MMTTLDQVIPAETIENDVAAHQLLIWAMFAINAVMIVIAYARLPVTDFYHVSEGGLRGGLGRVLIYANFPASLAALALIGLAVRRLRLTGMVPTTRARHTLSALAIVGAALCLVTAVPGVVDTKDLDAKPINIIPALGVLIAFGLTLASFRAPDRYRLLPWSHRDRFGLVLIAVLTVVSLPWILADLGVYIGDIPLLGRIAMSKEIPEGETLRAVHLGHHHGLDGWLFVVTSLTLGRLVRRDIASRMASVLRGYFGLMFSYGLLNLIEDGWLEQIVKRGWTDAQMPDVLVPDLSIGWALIIAGAFVAWYLLFRPVDLDRQSTTLETHTMSGAGTRA